jgi:hydrogenase maturation protein HypF
MHEVTNKTQLSCLALDVQGQVQGVGFRPFVYRLARLHSLKGEIFNHDSGAGALLEGEIQNLENFISDFHDQVEKPIIIDSLNLRHTPVNGFVDLKIKFPIKSKNSNGERRFHLQPDSSTCSECWKDYFNPQSRFYGYVFISCSSCGPRWTITNKLPFERENTSYSAFPLCSACQHDYKNSANRRFHAQTISCPTCGPKLRLIGPDAEENLTEQISKLLSRGAVGAVKGLGGFQLICDASNPKAIQRIRKIKDRPDQALSIMYKDISIFNKYGGKLSDWNKLIEPEAAIHCLENIYLPLNELIAPELFQIGCMAPTTPLHHSIMPDSGLMIVTSCNKKSFPIARTFEEISFLQNEMDFILDHNREIVFSIDDSVVRNRHLHRAARGFRPKVLKVKPCPKTVLALGADLKNSVAVLHSTHLIELPYNGSLGDLDGLETIKKQVEKQMKLFEVKPEVVLCDRHPQTMTVEINPYPELKTISISHHFSHALADKNPEEKIILTFDGTGFNEETIASGGEGYILKNDKLIQVLSMRKMPLVGGDSAIQEPWKVLTAILAKAGFDKTQILQLMPDISDESLTVIFEIAQNENLLQTTSVGRWFDAMSSLITFKNRKQTYEAQAPMILESSALQYFNSRTKIDFNLENFSYNDAELFVTEIKPDFGAIETPIFEIDGIGMAAYFTKLIISDDTKLLNREAINKVAFDIHFLIAEVSAIGIRKISEKYNIKIVVGSGGVFQNELFSYLLKFMLQKKGIKFHRPSWQTLNDQSIARGQLLSRIILKDENYA